MTEQTAAQRRNVIVVGVDGSDSSKSALAWAARIAPALGATVEAVIAWRIPAALGWTYVPVEYSPEHDARTVLENTLHAVFPDGPPASITQVVTGGDAAQVLVGLSAQARMLVLGSRGHGGFAGLLLGSVSSQCAEHSACPVLVMHEHDNQPISPT